MAAEGSAQLSPIRAVYIGGSGELFNEGNCMIFKRIGRLIFWIIECCGAVVGSAGIVLLYISLLAWLKTGTWPAYNLQMFWTDFHLQPPQVEWIGASLLALIPKVECWIAFLIVGGGLFILGFVAEGVLDNSQGRRNAY